MKTARTTQNTFPPSVDAVGGASVDAGGGDSITEAPTESGAPSKGKRPANGKHWYPRYHVDFDLIRREHPEDYPVLSAMYDVLMREAQKEESLSVTLTDKIIADRIGFSESSRTKIQARKLLFVEMGLAKMPAPERDRNSKKYKPTTWELTPSYKPWFDDAKTKNRVPKNAQNKGHGNKKPCPPKCPKNDANGGQTLILLTESKDIRKGSRKNICSKSEKAAFANAPLSDSTKEKRTIPIGPAAFFAGVDS